MVCAVAGRESIVYSGRPVPLFREFAISAPAITRLRLVLLVAALIGLVAEAGWFMFTPSDKPRSFIDMPPLFAGAWLGDADKQFKIGYGYLSGDLGGGNLDKAIYWFRKAADNGDVRAKRDLMLIYLDNGGDNIDYPAAGKYMREAALAGDKEAKDKLASALYFCSGKNHLLIESAVQFKYCRIAAEAGFAEAQWVIAVAYSEGNFVTVDKAKSVEWFRRSAKQGDARAAAMLGLVLQGGHGFPRDIIEAYAWNAIASRTHNEKVSKVAKAAMDTLESILSAVELKTAKQHAEEYPRSFRKELQP